MPVVSLKNRLIPRNSKGDPAFTRLICYEKHTPDCLKCVFTDEEIVAMVNRYLYQAFYQLESHKKRAKAEVERLAPLKAMVRKLFHKSFITATPKEIEQAQRELEKGETTGN